MQIILAIIYRYLKRGGKENVEEALGFMSDMGLTNEHLKEHLMTLCMDSKVV